MTHAGMLRVSILLSLTLASITPTLATTPADVASPAIAPGALYLSSAASSTDTARQQRLQRQLREQRRRAERLRKQREFRDAMQANSGRLESISTGYKNLAERLRRIRRQMTARGFAPGDPRIPENLRSDMAGVRAMGGEYYAAQIEYALATGGTPPTGTDTPTPEQAAANNRVAVARKQINDAIAELERLDTPGATSLGDRHRNARRLLARGRLRDAGGELTLAAYEVAAERRKLAREAGLSPYSPFLDRHVPLIAGDSPGALISQGQQLTCGYVAVRMASSRCRARPIDMAALTRVEPIRFTDGGAVGVTSDQISRMLNENNMNARAIRPGAGLAGARTLAANLIGNPDGGPFIIGVEATRQAAALADGMAFYMPEAPPPGLSDAATIANTRNRYRHWVVVDSVFTLEVDRGRGVETVQHFLIRDPDGGKAFFYSVEDLGAIFDGNAVQLSP